MTGIRGKRFILPLGGILLLLLSPGRAAAGVREGLRLSGTLLIPALFPVSVLAGCLIRMGPETGADRLLGGLTRRLLGLSGVCAVPLVLGQLGGFPLGAQLTASLYRQGLISREDALRLSALSNQAGPAFLLGALGTILGGAAYGAALLLIQALSVLLCGLLVRNPGRQTMAAAPMPRQNACPGFWELLPQALGESAVSMLRLTGAVSFFLALRSCLRPLLEFLSLPGPAGVLLSGFLELSGGAAGLSGLRPQTALPAAALLTGWGGLCVHLQAAEALSGAGLSLGPYLKIKLAQSGICLNLALLLETILGFTEPAALVPGLAVLPFFLLPAIFQKYPLKKAVSVV